MGKGKRSRKKNEGEGPKAIANVDAALGHNSIIKSPELKSAFGELDKLFDKKESANAEFMADINGCYERLAGKLGTTRKILREVYTEARHQKKIDQRYKDYDDTERDDHDRLMAAAASFGNTPFGLYAQAMAKAT